MPDTLFSYAKIYRAEIERVRVYDFVRIRFCLTFSYLDFEPAYGGTRLWMLPKSTGEHEILGIVPSFGLLLSHFFQVGMSLKG